MKIEIPEQEARRLVGEWESRLSKIESEASDLRIIIAEATAQLSGKIKRPRKALEMRDGKPAAIAFGNAMRQILNPCEKKS